MADQEYVTKMEAEAFELLQKRFEELMQLRKALIVKLLGSAYTHQCPADGSLYTRKEADRLGNICKISDHWLEEREPVYQLAGKPITRAEVEKLMEIDLEKASDDEDDKHEVEVRKEPRKRPYDARMERQRDSMTSEFRENAKARDEAHGPTDDEMDDRERKRHGIAAKGAINWPVVSTKPEAHGSSLTRKAAGRLDGERLNAGRPPKRTTVL